MDLYIGQPVNYLNRLGNGYALSHEMKDNVIVEKYKSLNNLILDNGADELGEGQGGSRLAYLAGKLDPDWIILPDVLHKDKKTRNRGLEFYAGMKDSGYKGKYIAVIQAKTVEKGLESYKFWSSTGIVDRIGVTYDTKIETPWVEEPWGKRLGFLYDLVYDDSYWANPIPIHMLGTLEVAEMFKLHRDSRFSEVLEFVGSHDTTAPWACDTKFNNKFGVISFGREKNWERLDFNISYTEEQLDVRYWNVACYLAACLIPKKSWEFYMPRDRVEVLFNQLEVYYA